MNVINNIMGTNHTRKPVNTLHNFNNQRLSQFIRSDRYSRNDKDPLTHNQAQALLPTVGSALTHGLAVDKDTLKSLEPYLKIGAVQTRADPNTGAPTMMRLTKGTGYRGPADPEPVAPVTNITNEKYTFVNYPDNQQQQQSQKKLLGYSISGEPVYEGMIMYTGATLYSSPTAARQAQIQKAIDDANKTTTKTVQNVVTPTPTKPPVVIDQGAYTKVLKDSKGNIIGYQDSKTGALINPGTGPITAPKSTYIDPNSTKLPTGVGTNYGANFSNIVSSNIPKSTMSAAAPTVKAPTSWTGSNNWFANTFMPTKEVGQQRQEAAAKTISNIGSSIGSWFKF